MRISDADRQRVIDELDRHLAAGRIGFDTHTERLSEVLTAETLADLDHARRDLPYLGPARRVEPPTAGGGRRGLARAFLLLVAVLVAAAVLLAIGAETVSLAVLAVGWVLGVALGRASTARG